MKALQWAIRCILFLLVLSFSLRNTQPVSIELFPGYVVQHPLIIILLLTLISGVVVAWIMLLPTWLKARKIINTQTKTSINSPTVADKENGI